ncbi:MAG: hypothetical protein NZT61_02775 [Deltaproteobacteria bacterium]|nr:hypothetical protein [Deltaproteobacteria bacterium]MCX7952702.1 hypothetical protein [Deltaproteobacteria bacterium]
MNGIDILVAGFGTLAVYTYLIGENRFYRFFEHLFIGVAAGYLPYFLISNFLWPKALAPLLGFDILLAESYEENQARKILVALSLVIGLFFYVEYFSKRLAWATKIALTIVLASSAGLAIKGAFNELIPQLNSSLKPIISETLKESFSNFVFLTSLFFAFAYFIFSFNTERTRFSKFILVVSKAFLMICFGAFFGSTVSARLSILIERIDFLKNQWLETIRSMIF